MNVSQETWTKPKPFKTILEGGKEVFMKRFISLLVVFFCGSLLVLSSVNRALAKNEEGDAHELEEVVVTATRYEEKLSSVPANVTVITEVDIKNSTAQYIPDLLRTQVGIHVNDITGNRRSYNVDIRGFGETGRLNTLVLVDGRRINQPDLSGSDWTLIPLDRIKRIEIIRGGRGSVLYGDNAAGGVINIITKEGDRFKAGGEAAGGSYDTFNSSAYVSGSQNDLSYALSGSYLDSDGYRDNSDTEAKDLALNLGYYFADFMKLDLSGGYHEDDTGLPGGLKESDLEAGASRRDSTNPEDFADVEDYYLKGGSEIFFLNDSLFKIDISFRKRDSFFFSSFFGGTFEGDTEIETITFSPQIIFKEKVLGLSNSLTFGYDFVNSEEDIRNKVISPLFPSDQEFKLEKENDAYYIHDEINLLEDLAISAGYRHDRAEFKFKPSTPDKTKEDQDLYTAGINYNFLENSYAYLSFSRSFRYPVLDEFFSFFTNTINTGLTPQRSDDYELGIRQYFTENLYASINLFRIDTKDEIFYNPKNFSNENLDGKTRRDGVEASLTTKFHRVTLSGSYTYTDATVENGQFAGNEVPNVPKHKATLDTLLSLGGGFTVAVNGTYIGERPFESDFSNAFNDQKDYFVLNTKLKYHWKYLTAFLDINNITNEEYSEYGVLSLSGFPVEKAFYPSPKINFLLGLRGDF